MTAVPIDVESYRQSLSVVFADIARTVYSHPPAESGPAAERTARGLLDVSEYVASLPCEDPRLATLAAFHPDPDALRELLDGRQGDPRSFRAKDPDERISTFLDRFVESAIDAWTDWGADPTAVTASPLVDLVEDESAPLESKLAAIGQLQDYLEFLEQWHVEEARHEGWSWARVALPLRRSRQAVQQRWGSSDSKKSV